VRASTRVRESLRAASLGVALLAIAAGRTTSVRADDEIFVSNYESNTINVYARTASGDVAPVRTIRTALDQPHTLGADLLRRELFVANNRYEFQNPSIMVYDLGASFRGNDQPKRSIAGPTTLLDRPAGLLVDPAHDELYVANDLDSGSAILVFPLDASGDVAPTRILQGPKTGIEGPIGLALDLSRDELFVVNYKVADGGSVTVFPRTASGNATPLRVIQGTSTGFYRPQGIAIDPAHDEIIVANSFFGTASPGSISVFARTDSGNVTPVRQIAGPSTGLCNPIGMVLDGASDEIVVVNSRAGTAPCRQSVTVYARAASGDAAPVRRIGPGPHCALTNAESVLVTRTSSAPAPPSRRPHRTPPPGSPGSRVKDARAARPR
jgi:DNA-binding beta-propeller fold protein YncE